MVPKQTGLWALIPLAGNPVNCLPMACPMSSILSAQDLYRIALAQAEAELEQARFTRRVLETGAGEHAWN